MCKKFLLLLVLIPGGCATGPYPVSSPYYQIPEGSRLLLKRPLTIPPNKARVYLQYGNVVTAKGKDRYHAHCWFLSRQVLDRAQTITPDTFIVVKTKQYEELVQLEKPQLFASRYNVPSMFNGNGLTAIESITELTIHSDAQADIYNFACSHWSDPIDARHLTLAEMQQALGDIADIQVKDGS